MTVTVVFKYEPDEPDDHAVGMSDEEYTRLLDGLLSLGATDVEVRAS